MNNIDKKRTPWATHVYKDIESLMGPGVARLVYRNLHEMYYRPVVEEINGIAEGTKYTNMIECYNTCLYGDLETIWVCPYTYPSGVYEQRYRTCSIYPWRDENGNTLVASYAPALFENMHTQANPIVTSIYPFKVKVRSMYYAISEELPSPSGDVFIGFGQST